MGAGGRQAAEGMLEGEEREDGSAQAEPMAVRGSLAVLKISLRRIDDSKGPPA
jgi:hypothetical protein